MAKPAKRRPSYVTTPGKHGKLYLWEVAYQDVSGEPKFKMRMWGYNREHLEDRFYSGPDEGDWEFVSAKKLLERDVQRNPNPPSCILRASDVRIGDVIKAPRGDILVQKITVSGGNYHFWFEENEAYWLSPSAKVRVMRRGAMGGPLCAAMGSYLPDSDVRKALRNPFTWRSNEDPVLSTAAGAGVGSLAGLLVGAPMGASGLGSVVGGALGGYAGAPRDRKRRGAWGGGIGGLFTPIGAAAGGGIAGRKPSKRNPWAYSDVKFHPARERLQELIQEVQYARVQATTAESRKETKEARKWRKIEADADLKLLQLEARLENVGVTPGPTQPNPSKLKKRLMR